MYEILATTPFTVENQGRTWRTTVRRLAKAFFWLFKLNLLATILVIAYLSKSPSRPTFHVTRKGPATLAKNTLSKQPEPWLIKSTTLDRLLKTMLLRNSK